MNFIELLDRPIAFHRCFVTITNSVTASVMLSQALYWSKRTTIYDNWFWKTQEEWFDETGLTRYEQEGARKVLKRLGIFEEKKEGIPAKLYFRVNIQKMYNLLEITPKPCFKPNEIKDAGFTHTSKQTNSILCSGKLADSDVEKPLYISETTTETTTEITKDILWNSKNSNTEHEAIVESKKFTIPTFDQVSEHIKNKNYHVDAEVFMAHYTSNGWMVGKNKMKCWKSALVTWEKGNKTKSGNKLNWYEKEEKRKAELKAEQGNYNFMFDDMQPPLFENNFIEGYAL